MNVEHFQKRFTAGLYCQVDTVINVQVYIKKTIER